MFPSFCTCMCVLCVFVCPGVGGGRALLKKWDHSTFSSSACFFSVSQLQSLQGDKIRTYRKVQGYNTIWKNKYFRREISVTWDLQESFLEEVVPMLKGKELNYPVDRRGVGLHSDEGWQGKQANMLGFTENNVCL